MHLIQAGLAIGWSSSISATAMIALTKWAVFGCGRWPLVPVLIVSSLLALSGIFYRVGRVRIFLFALQQVLLGIMAWGGIVAAINGAYLDGTAIPWPQIVSDQLPYVIVFVSHLYATIQRSQDPDG